LSTAIITRYPIAVLNENGGLLGIVDRASILAEVGGDAGEAIPLHQRAESPNAELEKKGA
jgi:hypothetical protein